MDNCTHPINRVALMGGETSSSSRVEVYYCTTCHSHRIRKLLVDGELTDSGWLTVQELLVDA